MDADKGTEHQHGRLGVAAGAVRGAPRVRSRAAIPTLGPLLQCDGPRWAHVGGMAAPLFDSTSHEEKTKRKPRRTIPCVDMLEGHDPSGFADPQPSEQYDLLRRWRRDLERAQGEWSDGEWVDFDPLAPPHKIGVENRR